jgi:hypothetical protein
VERGRWVRNAAPAEPVAIFPNTGPAEPPWRRASESGAIQRVRVLRVVPARPRRIAPEAAGARPVQLGEVWAARRSSSTPVRSTSRTCTSGSAISSLAASVPGVRLASHAHCGGTGGGLARSQPPPVAAGLRGHSRTLAKPSFLSFRRLASCSRRATRPRSRFGSASKGRRRFRRSRRAIRRGVSSWMDQSGIPPWTTSTMVTRTEVEHCDADASTAGLRVIAEEALDDALGR